MKEKILYIVWGCLYVLCVGLGLIEGAQGFGKAVLIFFALLFFVPGFWLLYLGRQDRKKKKTLRLIAIVSLSLTLALLVVNLLSVALFPGAALLLHQLLLLVSVPMFCGQYWAISLFLWACLLFGTFIKKEV